MKFISLLVLFLLISFGSGALRRIPVTAGSVDMSEYKSVQDLLPGQPWDTARRKSYDRIELSRERIEAGYKRFLRGIKLLYVGGALAIGGAGLVVLILTVIDLPIAALALLLVFGAGVTATGVILAIVGTIFYFVYRKYRDQI